MSKIMIIHGKCHTVLFEVPDRNEYIISYQDTIYLWRPRLRLIGFEYTDINQACKIIEDIISKKYRSEKVKKDLLDHWNVIIQIMRDNIIDKVLETERVD